MKITICGSLKFIEEMKDVKEKLENLGHEVLIPLSVELNQSKEYWNKLKLSDFNVFLDIKGERMTDHFDKVKSSDAILVLNYDKDGKKDYIGGNILIEMAIAFEHGKKIFLFNQIPMESHYVEEIASMKPIILNGNLDLIK